MCPRLTRLLHPAFLLALAVLLVNDHVLKDAFASPITGKLSDFAGLVVLPVLLTTGFAIRSRQLVWAIHGVIGLAFAAVQFVPESALWAVGVPAQHTPDPTDLVALAILPFGVRLSLAESRQRVWMRPVLANAVGLVAVVGVLATAPPRPPAVVNEVPVLRAATSEEGFLALEQRLVVLGFQPTLDRPPFVSYSEWLKRPSTSPHLARDTTQWRSVYEQQRREYEAQRGGSQGRETYSVVLSVESCPLLSDSTAFEMSLNAMWHPQHREVVASMYGHGIPGEPYNEESQKELRRVLSECLVGPLREAADLQ